MDEKWAFSFFPLTRLARSPTFRPAMLGEFARLVVAVSVFAVPSPATPAGQTGLEPAPQQGVLILRSGGVLRGKITRAGERYYVALPDGEIRVRAAEVEFRCRDLEEAYRHQRASVQPASVHDHLRLARWCLRHRLLGHAGRELADALEADPTHPMIAVLRRRLQAAREPDPPRRGAAEGTPSIGGPPAKPLDRPPSLEELDRLVRTMPRGTVETFTETIQPLLINHCATAGCHGPRPQGNFRLLRIPAGRPPTRRLTQRNLHAVVPWIDPQQPAASPLLTAAAEPHGAAAKAILTEGQDAQYRRLADWVCQVANRSGPGAAETVTPRQEPPAGGLPAESGPLDPPPAATPGAPDQKPAADSQPQKPPAEGGSVKRGARLPVFVPVDPFDPEIFNRRYFGNSEQ